jgi:molecular chaperone GrpE (heat shock protein)
VSFAYQKVDKGLILEDWKRYLETTEKATFDSEMNDFEWHAVLNDNKVIAIFQIINVLDQYAKNLKIHFHPSFKQEEYDIIQIIIFIYDSMLNICDDKGIKKLKLYIDDVLMHSIFMIIATHQADNEDIIEVKNYSKWIEIQMK